MSEHFQTIGLHGISHNELIEFVEAEVATHQRIPFAMVRYSIRGEVQTRALRLDLDKRVFLDHLTDPEEDFVVQIAAPEIALFLSTAWHPCPS